MRSNEGGATLSQQISGTLCIFGSYDDSELYTRNRTLVRAVSACATKVLEVRPEKSRIEDSNHRRISSVAGLFRTLLEQMGNFWSLARQRAALRNVDYCFVPYPAYIDIFYLWLLLPRGERPKVIVDAFLCLRDTLVNDRKMLAPDSLMARLVGQLERSTLSRADLVFIDTKEQKTQLCEQYQLSPKRVIAVPVGIDEECWTALAPLPPSEPFRVLFWGTFIPLHGVETIVRAARLLQHQSPEIALQFVGDGQTADECQRLIAELGVTNIEWKRCLLPATSLHELLASAHCVLGIFGESNKAASVIPYKVYQALASNKIIISRQGLAISRLIEPHGIDGVVLVPAGDPVALAAAIKGVRQSYDAIYQQPGSREVSDKSLSNSHVFESVAHAFECL